jgi:hypothetical protein
MDEMTAAYLRDIVRTFQNYKALGDRAMDQIKDDDFHVLIDSDANSLAVIVKHIAGNLRSRFTDFLTSDGEKPNRNRDDEFEDVGLESRAAVLDRWNSGWTIALAAIQSLSPEDLSRPVTIRGEAFLVVEALNRSATHTAYHVGQILLLAKHFAGPAWTSLSIPKGKSAEHSKGSFKSGIVPKHA